MFGNTRPETSFFETCFTSLWLYFTCLFPIIRHARMLETLDFWQMHKVGTVPGCTLTTCLASTSQGVLWNAQKACWMMLVKADSGLGSWEAKDARRATGLWHFSRAHAIAVSCPFRHPQLANTVTMSLGANQLRHNNCSRRRERVIAEASDSCGVYLFETLGNPFLSLRTIPQCSPIGRSQVTTTELCGSQI